MKHNNDDDEEDKELENKRKRLRESMKKYDLKEKLDGIKCGFKNTSCPDQIAKALKEYKTKA